MDISKILDSKALPTLNNGNSYCIDAKVWNTLVEYIKTQTEVIKSLTQCMCNLEDSQNTNRELLLKIISYLKEGV